MTFKRQIEKGLKAQIKMQSLVTGQLMIYADYFPDKPLRLVRAETQVSRNPHHSFGNRRSHEGPGKDPGA